MSASETTDEAVRTISLSEVENAAKSNDRGAPSKSAHSQGFGCMMNLRIFVSSWKGDTKCMWNGDHSKFYPYQVLLAGINGLQDVSPKPYVPSKPFPQIPRSTPTFSLLDRAEFPPKKRQSTVIARMSQEDRING